MDTDREGAGQSHRWFWRHAAGQNEQWRPLRVQGATVVPVGLRELVGQRVGVTPAGQFCTRIQRAAWLPVWARFLIMTNRFASGVASNSSDRFSPISNDLTGPPTTTSGARRIGAAINALGPPGANLGEQITRLGDRGRPIATDCS
jgi:hypothetical protein